MNRLKLYRKKYSNNFDAYSENPFFSEPIICSVFHDRIEFRHPSIDCNQNVHKANKLGNKWKFGITGERLEEGVLYLNEEDSDLDVLVFNIN